MVWVLADELPFQVTGIFRGGLTTLLRESLGNAVFFSIYEYVRYYMHLQLKAASSDHNDLIDVGIGIVTGGLGGVAVSIDKIIIFLSRNTVQASQFSAVDFFFSLLSFWPFFGVQFWSAVLPLDVAKTIIQTASDKSSTKNPFRILNSVRSWFPTFLFSFQKKNPKKKMEKRKKEKKKRRQFQ